MGNPKSKQTVVQQYNSHLFITLIGTGLFDITGTTDICVTSEAMHTHIYMHVFGTMTHPIVE